jgi:tRNA1Val (adenine37-N6)-methyltransferase
MNDYYQPSFYRFNEDSLHLVKFVASKVKNISNLLDLGAGSGILGIELSNILMPKNLCFVEAQSEWEPFLSYNLNKFLSFEIQSRIFFSTFGDWIPEERFDLIISNPPYFLPGHGQSSPDKRREISRSFIIDGWAVLLNKISRALSPHGKAFIVVRNDERILQEIIKNKDSLMIRTFTNKNTVFVELFLP